MTTNQTIDRVPGLRALLAEIYNHHGTTTNHRDRLCALLMETQAAQPQGEPTGEQCEAGCQAYMKADGKNGPFVMHLSSMSHAYKAMRALEQSAPVAVVLPERLQQVLKFLDGAENLDGHWFGEPHPSGRQYWWRNELRKALADTNLFAK